MEESNLKKGKSIQFFMKLLIDSSVSFLSFIGTHFLDGCNTFPYCPFLLLALKCFSSNRFSLSLSPILIPADLSPLVHLFRACAVLERVCLEEKVLKTVVKRSHKVLSGSKHPTCEQSRSGKHKKLEKQ